MMERQALHVNPVAMDLAWREPGENLRRMEAAVRDRLSAPGAPEAGAQLFLFPELTLTGFVTQDPPCCAANPADPVFRKLCAMARRLKTAVAAGFPEKNPKDPKRPFNALAFIGPDGNVLAVYRKLHLFTSGRHPEAAGYAAGDGGVVCVYRGWKIGFAICFDLRFPALFHRYAREGTELLLVSSCWVGGAHKSCQYRTLNSAYAVLLQAYVACVNRSGKDPNFDYDGAEHVFSPFGEDVYRNAPYGLSGAELRASRGLIVRPADREDYSITRV